MDDTKYSIDFLSEKYKELIKKEEEILDKVDILYEQYLQLQEDKELLEYMIMHKVNKTDRMKDILNHLSK